MGRIFEVGKSTIFARWDRMAKQWFSEKNYSVNRGINIFILCYRGGTIKSAAFLIFQIQVTRVGYQLAEFM